MLFNISIPARFVPRSRRRSTAVAAAAAAATGNAKDATDDHDKVGRYIRDIVANLENSTYNNDHDDDGDNNICSSPVTMDIPTIETTDVAVAAAAASPDETGSMTSSNGSDRTMNVLEDEQEEERHAAAASERGRTMTSSRTARSDSTFLSIPSSSAGRGGGDNCASSRLSPRSSSRSSARSTRSTRSFLSSFNIARRLSASISPASATERANTAPTPASALGAPPRSRANGRPRPHSTSSLPNPPPLFNSPGSFDPTPTYTPNPPAEPLDDIFPPVYHCFTEGPDAYQVVAEIPTAMPQDQAFQVFVYDDDRELAFAASQAQMGVRLKLPLDADLAGVKATVSGEILTIRIAKLPFFLTP
ncbi:hypothetical protein HDU86_004200 [Geranomyces michiganensis]|nr:hypothetical protein HDU86_004200 [Geranomyces michiganensis]